MQGKHGACACKVTRAAVLRAQSNSKQLNELSKSVETIIGPKASSLSEEASLP